MRRFLLDTGPAQDFVNRRHGVLERADAERHRGSRIGICVPVLGELWAGVEGSRPRDRNLRDRYSRKRCRRMVSGNWRGEEDTMTDTTTKKPLRVSTDGTAGPYIRVPVSQLDQVRQLLDSRRIFYWVAENAISLDGAPYVAVINLGRGGDAAAVQDVLDSAS